ncbi:MAG: NAD(P)/FAD-dependent oxidoreductase [Azospirillaceae bacterium]
MPPDTSLHHDAVVIGGSYAGLSAALQLARARRRVAVVDAGRRRNRAAAHAHGFLGQDGREPGAIVAEARDQLLAYPTVAWIEGEAAAARKAGTGFEIETGDGRRLRSRRLVLATGVVDELPDIPGLAERWGRSVAHCPYCHGYEMGDGPIGVLASSELSMHHALMLPDWGETVLFTNDVFTPDGEQSAALARRGVRVESQRVMRISGERADMELADGRTVRLTGLMTLTRTRMATPLAGQLGCALADGPTGAFVETGMTKETSVPGVFACGDLARAAGSVALAVGDGAMAGAGAHQSMIFRPD